MRYKYNYDGTTEGQAAIVAEHGDKILVEVQDITEGHFLVFADSATEILTPEPVDLLARVESMEQGQLDIMQGMADIWAKLNGGV